MSKNIKEQLDSLNTPGSIFSRDNGVIGDISQKNAQGLRLFGRMLQSGGATLSETEKTDVRGFFEGAIGNTGLNKFLGQSALKRDPKTPTDLTKGEMEAVKKVSYFSFKTRNLKRVEKALEKLDNIHKSVTEGKEVLPEDRLTLREFAMVSDLVKISPLMNKLEKDGITKGSETLTRLHASATKAKTLTDTLEQTTNKELQDMGAGVLVLDHSFKKTTALDRVWGFFDKIRALFCKHGHASMLHIDPKTQDAQRSHIDPEYGKERFDIVKQVYADMYKIDPIALIPKDMHQVLEQTYGKSWKEQVTQKFKAVDTDLHTKNFSNLAANSPTPQYFAGLADIIPFGHKKFAANDWKKLHNDMMEGKQKADESMLCSEFSAVMIAVSIVELN